jgi:antitoxin VapB
MDRAKLFQNGQSQAVRLPKPLRFHGTEVYATRFGNGVLLTPVNDPWGSLREALSSFSDDFMNERVQPSLEDRDGIE